MGVRLFLLAILCTTVSSEYETEAVEAIVKRITSIMDNLDEVGDIMEDVEEYVDLFEGGLDLFDALTFFTSSSSDEGEENEFVAALKEAFVGVNSRLHGLETSFEDVKRRIDWTTMRVNIMRYEHAIRSLFAQFELYLNSPKASREVFKDMFLSSYPFVFEDAPLKVYMHLIANGSVFQSDILKIARKYLNNNRQEVAKVMSYFMRIIILGTQVQCSFLRLNGASEVAKRMKEEWKPRLENLKKLASKVEQDMIDSWVYQYRLDADRWLLQDAQTMSNKDLTIKLYHALVDKYPWRKWFVLVYDYTDNDIDRYFDNCGEYISSNVHGKGVIINSIPYAQKKPKVNVRNFFYMVKKFEGQDIPFGVWADLAKIMFEREKSDCRSYSFKGVLESKSNPFFIAYADFYSFRTTFILRHFYPYKPYMLFVFA